MSCSSTSSPAQTPPQVLEPGLQAGSGEQGGAGRRQEKVGAVGSWLKGWVGVCPEEHCPPPSWPPARSSSSRAKMLLQQVGWLRKTNVRKFPLVLLFIPPWIVWSNCLLCLPNPSYVLPQGASRRSQPGSKVAAQDTGGFSSCFCEVVTSQGGA